MEDMTTLILPSSCVSEAIPTEGHLPLVIPGNEQDEYPLIPLHTESQVHLSDFLAYHLSSVRTREKVKGLGREFRILSKVHLWVPRAVDHPLA